jgi:hypothetical protein
LIQRWEDFLNPDFNSGVLIALSLAGAILFMAILARWARRRSKGALMAGALFSIFAPDPTFERNIRLAEEARQEIHEEDEEGELKD